MAKKKKTKVIQMLSPEKYIRQKARSLPIYESWVNSMWKENGLANILVARKHTNGNFTAGIYLVDLKCLGVKDAFYFFNISPLEYRDILDKGKEEFEFEKVNYNLVHNIIYAGLEFADDYGFKPHKDFGLAQYILEEDTEDIELIEIECGQDGKALYIQGPNESESRKNQILAQLEKNAGSGNYDYITEFIDDKYEEEDFEDDFFGDDLIEFKEKDIVNSKTYQFKIQIEGITNPPVWRRLSVPSYFTFLHFHDVIQAAFGWSNSHLFQFSEKGFGPGIKITQLSDEMEDDDWGYINSEEIILSAIFKKEKQKLVYIYDFGDSWKHKITLEKILPEISLNANCLEGKGQSPPEDCGGVWSYQNLKDILKDKSDPEYEEYMEWLGLDEDEPWNPKEFDLLETQNYLQGLFK